MDFSLSPEQTAMRDMAARFAKERLAPDYMKREKTGFDRAILKEMGGLGFIGAEMPEDLGGVGVDSVTAGLIVEEIAYGDFNVSYVQLVGSLCGQHPAHATRSRTWRARWVRRRSAAARRWSALGLTEPRGGSDAANLMLRADRARATYYVLNGREDLDRFADRMPSRRVFARTGSAGRRAPRASAPSSSPWTAPGISRRRFDDLGTRSVGRGSVFFDDVQVPAEPPLGDENRGFAQVMARLRLQPRADRPAVPGRGAGLAGRNLGLRQGARGLRPAAGQVPGRDLPAGRGRDAARSAARLLCYQTLWLRDARPAAHRPRRRCASGGRPSWPSTSSTSAC